MHRSPFQFIVGLLLWLAPVLANASDPVTIGEYTLESGHPSLRVWTLPELQYPQNNSPTESRIALGKALFFDPRLSGTQDMACASCHNPKLGWSDGLATAKGSNGKSLRRSTLTIINSGYNHLQTWDGRFEDLESQVLSPIINKDEMNNSLERLLTFLRNNSHYTEAFSKAYPGQGINVETLSKAIAVFERTVISTDSPFDKWVRGDQSAMTQSQINGFKVFLDPDKANCAICHSPPNFSDDGYHNIGLTTNSKSPDYGRYELVPVGIMKGAFKTPTLRDIESTKPYFHDGSAKTLEQVLNHYEFVDIDVASVSPALSNAKMTRIERDNLLDFLGALTSGIVTDVANTTSDINQQSTMMENNTTTCANKTKDTTKP